eukprot:2808317-Rhodomonas_salina.2
MSDRCGEHRTTTLERGGLHGESVWMLVERRKIARSEPNPSVLSSSYQYTGGAGAPATVRFGKKLQ